MMAPRTARRTVGALLALPLLMGPFALLAQAHPATPPDARDWIDGVLKWWGVASVFVIGGLHLWVRSIVRDHADAVRQHAEDALSKHDANPVAHANHPNAARYREEIGNLMKALIDVSTKIAVIDERIRSGQEIGAARWQHIEERLSKIETVDERLARIEAGGR